MSRYKELKKQFDEIFNTNEEDLNDNNYYVYRLLDPREKEIDGNYKTFYVGKGNKTRVFDHLDSSESKSKKLNIENLDNDNENNSFEYEEESEKLNVIREIHNENKDVIILIHRYNLSEECAFEVEAALIDAYGLEKLTNKQSGHNTKINGLTTIEDLISLKSISETNFENKKCILVNINKEYIKLKNNAIRNNAILISDQDVFNSTKGEWVLNIKRANKADYLIAHFQGRIIRCFKNSSSWQNCGHNQNRKYLNDKMVVNDLFANTRIPSEYLKSTGNPVRYVNC